MKIIGIACLNFNRAIGYNNNLLFDSKIDMKLFKSITSTTLDKTKKNAVIMGYNTYNSIPKKNFPLINRENFIISKNNYNKIKEIISNYDNTHVYNSIEKCISYIYENSSDIENIYIIGGYTIYNEILTKNYFDELILTEIEKEHDTDYGDIYFPELLSNYILIKSEIFVEKNVKFNLDNRIIPELKLLHNRYINNSVTKIDIKSEEMNYLNILKDVLNNGSKRITRNSITLSKFGLRMEFSDIENKFPLLTTKKLFWKGILNELLWFISGSTDSKLLEEKGVNIWKGNSTREYLDNNGLNHYNEGDCGPIYGYQWRNFNDEYNRDKNRSKKGVDQLQNCIDLIKNDPTSRRIFMTAWNPCQLKEMVLPPCHVSYQFYVDDNTLNCQMYQRSGDLFLGVPFNIASTALLTCLIAKTTNLKAGKIIIILGDAHIYENHIDQVKRQLERVPYIFPKLNIKNSYDNINNYIDNDIELLSYNSYKGIKAEMIS